MVGKNNLKQEYGQMLRKHMIKNGDVLELSPEQFIRLRRLVRRKATRELADTAFRAYMAVLNIPTNGSFSKQHIQNLAALSISSHRIVELGLNAQDRLDMLFDQAKVGRAKMAIRNKSTPKEFKMALGK